MAYNPFVPFQYFMFEGFVKKGQVYFVLQTFERARDHLNDTNGYFLLTHYEHLSHAQTHESAVRHDPGARLFYWANKEDRELLKELVSPVANNRVYTALIGEPGWDEKAKRLFKPSIQKWIQEHTKWTISRETILPVKFNMIFGELFISMKWNREEKRINLRELERM